MDQTEYTYHTPSFIRTVLTDVAYFAIPVIGTFIVLIKTYNCFTKTSDPVFGQVPVKVEDRRYTAGYKVVGYEKGRVGVRMLQTTEIQNLRRKGFYHLIFWSVLVIAVVFYYLS